MRIGALTGVIALLLVGTAHAVTLRPLSPRNDPGISATSIKLGGIIDQTGRGKIVSMPILGGYQLAVKQVNAAGGVNGRKIDYVAESDNYDPSQTLPVTKKLVESEGVFAVMGVFGSDDANVAAPYLEQQHIPLFDPIGGGANISGKKWVWQTEPDYAREGAVIAKYVAGRLHAQRIAILYQVGVGESQIAALKKVLPKYHASLVAQASYEAIDNNFSGQVQRLNAAKPDIVVLNGTPTPTALFLQYARAANFKPRIAYLANYPMGDPLWLALTGGNAEGNYVSSYADLTGNNRVAAAYRKALARYHGDKYSNYGLYGYFNAMLMFDALRLTGKHPTRAGLKNVLDHRYRNYVTGFTGRISWSAKQHYGARQFKIYRVQNGKFVPVTGWITP